MDLYKGKVFHIVVAANNKKLANSMMHIERISFEENHNINFSGYKTWMDFLYERDGIFKWKVRLI